jgi:WD40 repeat protein
MAWISCVTISWDNKWIAVADQSGRIIIYDLDSSEPLLKIYDPKFYSVSGLSFDLDNQYLITVARGKQKDSVRVYKIPSGEFISYYQHNTLFINVEYCHTSHSLITLDDDNNTLKFWCFDKEQLFLKSSSSTLFSNKDRRTLIYSNISKDKDCNYILFGGFNLKTRTQSYQILSLENFTSVWELKNFPANLPFIQMGTLSPDAHLIAFTGQDYLLIWDRFRNQELWISFKNIQEIGSIVFSQNSKYLYTGSRDCTVRIWSVDDGKLIKTFSTSKNYRGLQLTGVTGLSEEVLEELKQRSVI